jgi:hypothetical protein
MVGNPVRLDGPATPLHAPPELGDDTDAVLGQVLSLSHAAIAELKALGAVSGPGIEATATDEAGAAATGPTNNEG